MSFPSEELLSRWYNPIVADAMVGVRFMDIHDPKPIRVAVDGHFLVTSYDGIAQCVIVPDVSVTNGRLA
jgi:hypothetical protein